MSEPENPKIIQILFSPQTATWQGRLLGLGDDGAVYSSRAGSDRWELEVWPLWDPGEKKEENAIARRDYHMLLSRMLYAARNSHPEVLKKLTELAVPLLQRHGDSVSVTREEDV